MKEKKPQTSINVLTHINTKTCIHIIVIPIRHHLNKFLLTISSIHLMGSKIIQSKNRMNFNLFADIEHAQNIKKSYY